MLFILFDHAVFGVNPLNAVAKGGQAPPLAASEVQTPLANSI